MTEMDGLVGRIRGLMKLINDIHPQPDPNTSYTPNLVLRIASDGVMWLEVESDKVTRISGGAMIEEAHNVAELLEVVETFERLLASYAATSRTIRTMTEKES